jgi:hypothetical protein
MVVLPRTQEDDVISEAKLREHPLVIPRAAIRACLIEDEGMEVARCDTACQL